MRRSGSRRGRPVEYATLSRKASAIAELPADIRMTSRGMQTPVGVLKRIAVHHGSMTNTMICQRVVAFAMLSRKASATVEHPANFPMMSRKIQTLVGVLGMVNHPDQSGMESEILGVGMMIENKNIGCVTSPLRDQEVRSGMMTDILKEEEKDQKDADTMTWITSDQGTMEIVNAMKEECDRYMFVLDFLYNVISLLTFLYFNIDTFN